MNGVDSYKNRIRFPIEVVRAIREAVGEKFIIIYRLSMLDLIEKGAVGKKWFTCKSDRKAGATLINTGIGWHEARIPTIAYHGSCRGIYASNQTFKT